MEDLPYGGIGVTVSHGSIRFTAASFGIPHQWSFTPFQRPGDAAKHPEMAERIGAALARLGARRVYATRPTAANARIMHRGELTHAIPLPHGISLMRNGDTPADGTRLCPGEASAMTAGGCPRIVAVCGNAMADAHAGRDSLIDRACVLMGTRADGRTHESVVEALLESVAPHGNVRDVHAWIFFSIPRLRFVHDLGHKVHGSYNRKLLTHLMVRWGAAARASVDVEEAFLDSPRGTRSYLDVPRLIQAQFAHFGVPWEQVHLGTHAYASPEHLYDTRGENPQARNLIAVVRYS